MTRTEPSKQVAVELEHIPEWPGEHQAELRALYNIRRRRSLGKNAVVKQSANEVLQSCIAALRTDYPNVHFDYDKDFFEGEAKDLVASTGAGRGG